MEILAQLNFGQVSPQAYYIYGVVLLLVSAWVALNMEKPEK